jgi:hypothetical protein
MSARSLLKPIFWVTASQILVSSLHEPPAFSKVKLEFGAWHLAGIINGDGGAAFLLALVVQGPVEAGARDLHLY